MISHKYINDYISFVQDNPNSVSDDVKLLIENVVKPSLSDPSIYFDVDTYETCIKFAERWFYELFPYQKFRYAFAFMYQKDNQDVVKFGDMFDMMGRGNGKDGYLMPLACFLLTPLYGIKNYHIDIVANSEDQALNSFNVVYNMLESNKQQMKKMFYWNKTEVINRITKSKLRYNTANAKTKDGKQSGMIIFNELHAYEDYTQLNVFNSGLGKIKHARTWTITTDGVVRDGPLDEKIDLSKRVLNGESNYLGIFPFLCRISSTRENEVHLGMSKFMESKDPRDIDITFWEKANPSIRYMPILKDIIIKDYIKATEYPSYKAEFFTKRMNLPRRDEEISVTSWENILKASYSDIENKIERTTPVLQGQDAIVGIDLATFNDFVSAGFLFKIDGEYVWKSKTWICKRSKFFNEIKFPFENVNSEGFFDFEVVDEDLIDVRDVISWVIENMSSYNILKIVTDSHRFTLLKSTFDEYGIAVENKTNPEGLVRMIRLNTSIYNILAPQIEQLFIKGDINIGNSAMMRWAINNTSMKRNKNGDITFDKIEPKLRKNDPFMAFIHAMQAHELLNEQVITVWM